MKRNLWSSWSEYLKVSSSDNLEEISEKLVAQTKSDVMKLPLKDFNLFGYCSEYEDFYLIICKFCGKSIKPQSLNTHIELRHTEKVVHKLSFTRPVKEISLLSYLNCSTESTTNEDISLKINSSTDYSVSGTEEKLKIMNTKRNSVYVHPYPKLNFTELQENNYGNLSSYCPSSNMASAALMRNISAVSTESKKNECARKKTFQESSSSTCDSQTSMTLFLKHSFIMPNIKLCDMKDRHSNHFQCLSSKSLSEKNCLSKTTILTHVLPEKKDRQSVRSPRQVSQIHNQSDQGADWSNMQNSTNLGLNGMAYAAWNQHSPHFCPLPHSLPIGKSGQMNSHSFSCSDLTKKFGDLESQVLIHNAAMGT